MFVRLADKIATIALIVLGLISVTISTLDFFVKDLETIPILKETSQITLLLIGVLCFAIGLERFTKFEDMNKRLDKLFDRINNVAPTQVLDGRDAIYGAATELINDAKKVIRASSFRENHKAAPKPYLQSLTNKIERSKTLRQPVEYRLLYGYGSLADLIQTDTHHKAFFISHKIGEYFRYAYLNAPIGLDLLIIDNKHLLIALPTIATDPALRKGIKFVNAPDLVTDISSWYDNYLWSKASDTIPSTQ
ncbi:hypothetical protein KJ885_06330 [Patescibacteria group bacterium]|nr:hypothetical protein [Patescibacteria group bacterium]